MTVYQLLWHLLLHALCGRFRDEVFVGIDWELPHSSGSLSGAITRFYWEPRDESFCMIDAVSEDGPWTPAVDDVVTVGGGRG